jgi:hypothetical protein
MEWSVSAFEAVAVLSLPGWLIVEAVVASLRLAPPPSRRGSPRAGTGAAPAVRRRAASAVATGLALAGGRAACRVSVT